MPAVSSRIRRRLATVQERRSALTTLTRKYGQTIDDVLAWAEAGSARLLDIDGTDERIAALTDDRARLRAELAEAAETLSQSRCSAAERLAGEVTSELGLLAMPAARLEIDVRRHEAAAPADPEAPGAPLHVGGQWLRFGASGVDEVEFLLAANVGAEPRSLARSASGGELSRVMLALEVRLAATSPVPIFVFDEVDAGVGGKAAIEVGRRLAGLARTAQVLVVTHLPQVAAFADRHVVVHKADDGSVTTSGLTTLDDAARVKELSRMLAGVEESDAALQHARELLDSARSGS